VIQYIELIDFFSSINDEKNLEQTFLKAIRKFPRNSEVLLKYTKHLIERQRLEQAANYLSLAYQESPNNTEIWDVYIKFAGPKDKAIEEEKKKKMN
jgi:Tfp pilus assembly protein PilF